MPQRAAKVWLLCLGLLFATSSYAQIRLEHDSAKYSDKIGKRYRVTSASSTVAAPTEALAKVKLEARPISCVTLREGQPCFIKLAVSWQSDIPITACLVSEINEAEACWSDELSGTFRASLYLSETTVWQLQNSVGDALDEVEVSVAWVYESRRGRRNWRLF